VKIIIVNLKEQSFKGLRFSSQRFLGHGNFSPKKEEKKLQVLLR
jgi:hypothetical protein